MGTLQQSAAKILVFNGVDAGRTIGESTDFAADSVTYFDGRQRSRAGYERFFVISKTLVIREDDYVLLPMLE